MDSYDPIGSSDGQSRVFIGLVISSQILGILCVILTGVWLGTGWGGFDWMDKRAVFNYHPLFMVLGLVFLYGDAILVYRVFRNYRKLPIKILHGTLHILAFVFAIVGLRAIFKFHENNNITNMYSLHSWLGIVAVVLFGVQWLVGLIAFLVPQVRQPIRARYLPIHVSFGSLLYLLIIGVCIAGITEKNFFSGNYSNLLSREVKGNVLGLFLVLFGSLVFYLISHPQYRRVEPVSPERRQVLEDQ